MSTSPRTLWNRTTLLGLALPALVVAMGLQLLRVFFPSLAWYLRDTVGVGSITLGGVALAAFLPGFLAPVLRRAIGHRGSLLLAAGGVSILRFIEQLSTDPALDLWLSAAGTACLVIFLPLFILQCRAVDSSPGYRWAGGMLLGLALDSTIKGTAGSLDLTWIPGAAPILVVALLAATALWLVWREPTPAPTRPTETTWREAAALLFLGPLLLLQAMVLQNQGWVAEVAGLSSSLALVLILLGNLVALAAFLAAFSWPHWIRASSVFAASVLLVLIGLGAASAGPLFPLLLWAAQAVLGWGLGVVATTPSATRAGSGRTSVMVTTGLILYLLLAFLYYVSFDLPLPLSHQAVIPVAALMAALALLAGGFASARPPLRDRTLLVPGLILTLLGIALSVVNARTVEVTPLEGGSVRVMTYNIHSAFNSAGRQDPEAIARVIEDSQPDIVVLQEVSRGWLIDSSTDLLGWLSARLGMQAEFQGTADPIWGNAILSRGGFLETGSAPLPGEGTLLPRGYLWARVDVGIGDPWLVVGTHLHHVPEEPAPRLAQIPVILDFLEGQPRVLLLGDLNSEPTWPEMELPRAAGLVDSWSEAGVGEGLTWPAADPFQRIDWIWHTPDLRAFSIAAIETTASDHRPVVGVFGFP